MNGKQAKRIRRAVQMGMGRPLERSISTRSYVFTMGRGVISRTILNAPDSVLSSYRLTKRKLRVDRKADGTGYTARMVHKSGLPLPKAKDR